MMKTFRRLTIMCGLLVATPALAQPGSEDSPPDVVVVTPVPVVVTGASPIAPQPAQPAPQNEDWNNVSHINGHPVPVGERGDFIYKWKKTNVATNPIGWMIGIYGISVSHAVTDNIAIRGDANILDIEDTAGYEVGASVPIYFKRVFQGPFIEPGIIVRELHDKDEFCDFDCSDKPSLGPSVVFGWHWTFDSGLNVAAAFGLMRNINKQDTMDFDSGSDIEPSGYFRVGYAF